MTFSTAQAVFYYLAAASVAAAILAVTRRNPVHSMLWVLALFLHVAGIFLLVGAEFLAAVQVLVYAGAILVFYLFILMLLDLPSEEARSRFGRHWPLAVAAGLGFAALTVIAQSDLAPVETGIAPPAPPLPPATESVLVPSPESPTPSAESMATPSAESMATPSAAPLGSLSAVGKALFGPFALPFEIASLILLASIVGAVVLARKKEEQRAES